MAHSRPPPSTRAVTSPPLSPVATEKSAKNGSSKQSKSSKTEASKTRSSRPGTTSRRTTPQHLARTNSNQGSKRTGSREREREREREERDRYEDAETFLQFCSFCEKQIDGSAGSFLYCSESCRVRDLYTSPHAHHAHSSRSSASTLHSPPQSPSTRGSISAYYPTDGPDIIPRASPTLSCPRSYFNSDPFPCAPINIASSVPNRQSQHQINTSSKSATSSAHGSTSALTSLRELSAALETSKSQSNYDRSDSEGDDYSAPASPLSRSQNNSAVWNYNPFTTAKPYTSYNSVIPSTPKPITRSYTQPAGNSAGYGASAGYSYARFGSTSGASTYGGMDRPLPPRSGGYGHRPRSMDLVTPFSGGA